MKPMRLDCNILRSAVGTRLAEGHSVLVEGSALMSRGKENSFEFVKGR